MSLDAMKQALAVLEEIADEVFSPYDNKLGAAILALRAAIEQARLHEIAVHCERVERRLKEVNTAAMNLTHDLVCMDYDDDDRLNRDRVMARIMQWRNEWDKAMFQERNT